MKKTIFWDFDGTLVYSESVGSKSLYKSISATARDCAVELEEIRKHMRTGFTWHTPERDYLESTGGLWWDRLLSYFTSVNRRLGMDAELAEKAALRVKSEILNAENYRLYEDAVLILEACVKAGYVNYILSNNFPELPDVIGRLGLSEHFAGYIVSAGVGYEKP
jgi:putative hydrolase of the HAD superfamily